MIIVEQSASIGVFRRRRLSDCLRGSDSMGDRISLNLILKLSLHEYAEKELGVRFGSAVMLASRL